MKEKNILIKKDTLGRRTDRVKKREEKEMLRLNLQGLSSVEIAKRLKRKPQTVKLHLDSFKSNESRSATSPAPKEIVDSHRIDIQNFIKKYISILDGLRARKPDPFDNYWHSIEGDELFTRMLEHCPSTKNKYEIFKTKREEYCKALDPIYKELVTPLMSAMDGKIGQVLHTDDGAVFMVTEEPAIIVDAFVNSYDPCSKDIICRYSDPLLNKKYHEECHRHYWSIINANPNLATYRKKALQALHNVNIAERTLLDTLDTSLKSGEYLDPTHKCQWCPD